jgi:steroid delta-isomerase-like uncharacterized protein
LRIEYRMICPLTGAILPLPTKAECCQEPAASKEEIAVSDDIRTVPCRWFDEGFNKRNMALLDELFHSDVVLHAPSVGEFRGHDALKRYLAPVFVAMPDCRIKVEEQVAEGDRVVTRWTASGTHQSELFRITPSGKQVMFRGVTIARILDGKHAEIWEVYDAFASLQKGNAPPPAAEANKDLVSRYFEEIWNKFNLAMVEEFFAGDAIFRAPHWPELCGIEARKQLVAALRSAYPDGHFTLEEMVAEGNSVVARWTFRGTHKGELMGIAPTGREVSATGTSIFAVADGKIMTEWAEYDALGLWQQLGVIPPLAEIKPEVRPKAKAKAKPKPETKPKTKSKVMSKARPKAKVKSKPSARRQRR